MKRLHVSLFWIVALAMAQLPVVLLAADTSVEQPEGLVDLTTPDASKAFSILRPDSSSWLSYNSQYPLDYTHAFDDGVLFDRSDRCILKQTTADFGYSFNEPTIVNAYKIHLPKDDGISVSARAPGAWTFEGSNDKASWVTLDARGAEERENGWGGNANTPVARYYEFENSTAYRHYRLNVSAVVDSGNGGGYLQIAELEFFNVASTVVEVDVSEFSSHRTYRIAGMDSGVEIVCLPVLVRFNPSEMTFGRADHADLVFTQGDDNAPLFYEVDTWGTTEAAVWVCVDEAQRGASFTMHWGAQTDYATPCRYLWHDYASVVHFNGTASDSDKYEFTSQSSSTADGFVGGGAAGAKTKVLNPFGRLPDQTHFAAFVWTRPSSNNATVRILSTKSAYGNNGFEYLFVTGTGLYLRGNNSDKTVIHRGSNGTVFPTGEWTGYAAVVNGTAGEIYQNGLPLETEGSINSPSFSSGTNLMLGGYNGDDNGGNFSGTMDEFRLYRGVPTAARVKAEYQAASDPDFLTTGAILACVTVSGTPTMASATSASVGGAVCDAEGANYPVRLVYGAISEGDAPSGWSGATAWTTRPEGSFAETVSGLAADTEYRAAFEIDQGSSTAYSEVVAFSTAAIVISAPRDFYESEPAAKAIVFTRSASASALELSFTYALGGAAVAGADYAALPGTATFLAGESSVSVSFAAIDNAEAGGSRTVTVTVQPGAYVSGATASFAILDDESATAAECVWTGSGDGTSWDDPANWSGNAVPTIIDTAKFTDAAPAANGTVDVGSGASCRLLQLSRLGAMTIGGSGQLALGGIDRENLEGTEETHTIAAKLLVFGTDGPTNHWSLAGSGDFYASGDVAAASSGVVVRKTGSARLRFGKNDMSYTGAWHIAEGSVYVDGSNRMRGTLAIGGEETAAEVTFANNYCFHGNTAVTVLRNGRLYSDQGMNNSRISVLNVYDGGWARVGYFYLGAYTLRGGTVEGTAWSGIISTWPESLTTYGAERPSYFNVGYGINEWNPFPVTVADGPAPVDLVTLGFSGKDTQSNPGEFSKNGPGVIKVTGDCTTERALSIKAGTWLADNAVCGCTRGKVYVSAGATLGGVGSVLGTRFPDEKTVTVYGGTTSPGCLMPGSIDVATGAHVYGTLTVGSASVTNHVGMESRTLLKIGIGPKDAATTLPQSDKLMVHGNLAIGANSTLDLVANSAPLDVVPGGTYTIVEANAITGEFATVLKPKTGWQVAYESETVDGAEVVKRITLTVPPAETVIFIR